MITPYLAESCGDQCDEASALWWIQGTYILISLGGLERQF